MKKVTGRVCVVHSDQLVLVGQTLNENSDNIITNPGSKNNYFYDVGLMVVQRGTVPSDVQGPVPGVPGSMHNVKVLSICYIGLCNSPVPKLLIPKSRGLTYHEGDLDPKDEKVLRTVYKKFLNREPNRVEISEDTPGVTLSRRAPEVP